MDIAALAAFAGVVVCFALTIIFYMKDGPWKITVIGMGVCFVAVVALSILSYRSLNDTGTADGEPDPASTESQDAGEDETVEPKDDPGESVEPSAEPTNESEPPQKDGAEPYKITYESSEIYKDSLDGISCYALVEIENTGTVDLYLSDATFDFEDEGGNLLGTCSGIISSDPDIIAPGEKGYFYCNMGSVKGSVDEKTNYVFKPTLKVKESKNDIIRYDISSLQIADGGMFSPVSIIGRITNNTDEDAGLIWIACVLYRSDGTPIGVHGTNITDLAVGQTSSFDASASFLSHLDFKLSDVADYKVYASKTQFQF